MGWSAADLSRICRVREQGGIPYQSGVHLLDAVSISGERPQGQGIGCLRAPNTNSEDRNFSVV